MFHVRKTNIFISLIVFISLFFTTCVKAVELPDKTDHEKVKVYFFHGDNCPHCRDFIDYFLDYYDEYEDYFEVVAYETWSNEANKELLYNVKKELGDLQDKNSYYSVPYFVIGNSYSTIGYDSDNSTANEIINAALEAYKDENYQDIVFELASDVDGAEAKSFLKTAEDDGFIKLDKDGNIIKSLDDWVIASIIFAFIIVFLGGLVIYSKKK